MYKYYKYGWLESNDLSTTKDNTAGCIKNGAFCGTENESNILYNIRYENIKS